MTRQTVTLIDPAEFDALKKKVDSLGGGGTGGPTPPDNGGPVKPDSAVGLTVTASGTSIWLAGVEYQINGDKTVGVGAKVSVKSGNVRALSLRKLADGTLRVEQKAQWADGPSNRGTYTVPKDGSQGDLLNQDDLWSDEEVVLPPAPVGEVPDGFITFEGEVIPTSSQDDSWGGKYNLVASDWWVHQFGFSKENVVVVGKSLELRQRASKSGEVAWTKSLVGSGLFQVQATLVHLVIGVVYCVMFLYAQSASEIDSEIVYDPATGTWRREYRIHAPGGKTVFFRRGTEDPSGQHVEGIKYVKGKYVEWYVDGKMVCRATPEDLDDGPQDFPGDTMELLADCWGGSWTGGYDGSDATLTLDSYRIDAIQG